MDDPRDPRPAAPPGRGQVLHFPKAGAARVPADGDAQSTKAASELSTADLFALLWHAVADMLGTAAAATLLHRSAQRAAQDFPELAALSISRDALEYQFKVPEPWNQPVLAPPKALCALVRELWTLLTELTGTVVVNRLAQINELRERGIVPPREPQP